jgi:hypothetical protein
MLNKLDDIVAPNICQHTLFFMFVVQLIVSWISDNTYVQFLYVTSLVNLFFAIKVLIARQDRVRVYLIVKHRINQRGYQKSVFEGKCVSICQLAQAIYISMRFRSCSDFSFFWAQHKQKVPRYVMEDEKLENILNNLDLSNIKDGQVIHEYEK